jgi:hypothetical protein
MFVLPLDGVMSRICSMMTHESVVVQTPTAVLINIYAAFITISLFDRPQSPAR